MIRPATPFRREPARLAIVGCGAKKRSGRHALRDLYTGPLFTAARADVEARGLPWLVLSALYGLCSPEWDFDSYDRTIAETKREQACQRDGCGRSCDTARGWCWRRGFVAGVDARLRQAIGRHGRPLVAEVHAGVGYVDVLLATRAVQEGHVLLVEPLRGLELGARLSWYATRRRHAPGEQLELFGRAA